MPSKEHHGDEIRVNGDGLTQFKADFEQTYS